MARIKPVAGIALVVLLIAPMLSEARDIVCRTLSFPEFDGVDRKAAEIVGPSTTDISKLKLFITVSGSFLFLRSNFIVDGYSSPSRLALTEDDLRLATLDQLILNLVCADQSCVELLHSNSQDSNMLKRATVIVDRVKLSQSLYSTAQFSEDTPIMPVGSSDKLTSSPAVAIEPHPVPDHRDNVAAPPATDPDKVNESTKSSSATVAVESRPRSDHPDNIAGAFIDIFWGTSYGKGLLVVIACGISLFAVWNSLPDRDKSRMLSRLSKRRGATNPEDQREEA